MKTLKTELKELIKHAGEQAENLLKLRGMHPDHERAREVYEAAKLYCATAKLALKEGDFDAALTAIQIQGLCVDMYLQEISMFYPQIGKELIQPEPGNRNQSNEDNLLEHDIESKAYEVGKYLTQLWKLPNIQEKKKSVPKDTYDLTDKNRRFEQFLDENATLDEIIKRDIARQNKSSD